MRDLAMAALPKVTVIEPGKIGKRSGQPIDLARVLDRWFADSPLE
jgi:hypothetical protein